MKIRVKPATPWNVTLAKLQGLECKVAAGYRAALEARWFFGKELLAKRVTYQGRLVVPDDLMKLTSEQCKLGHAEINYRIQFAERYSTKSAFSTAVEDATSWTKIKKGFADKKQSASVKPAHSEPWLVRRLAQELDKAYTKHATLSRDQVKDLEQLLTKLKAILDQVDRNDTARAS